jgi:hypothetical protein
MDAKVELPPVSAEELHQYLLTAHRVGNWARHRYVTGLLALLESRHYVSLGCSSVFQYAEKHFGHQRTQTYEDLRVAKALRTLPRSTAAFDEGVISWCALQEITRVAAEATEEAWIAFARKRSLRHLKAEVQDAMEKGRDLPREDGYSIPRLKTRFVVELTPEEHELVIKALRKAAQELSASLGGKRVDLRQALLYLAQRLLETDLQGTPLGREERLMSIFNVLYHLCPKCRIGHVITDEGPVEVPAEVVERVEAEAERVEIKPEEEAGAREEARPEPAPKEPPSGEGPPERDRPNPRWLIRKVLLRDGQVCSNPFCRRKLGLHAHHIQLRSEGGRTALWNEAAVCTACHAALHQGLLRLTGDPLNGLQWRTRVDDMDLNLDAVRAELARVPLVAAPAANPGASGHPDASGCADSSGCADLSGCADTDAVVLQAMTRLGYSPREARERLARALAKLRGLPKLPDEGEILRIALSA